MGREGGYELLEVVHAFWDILFVLASLTILSLASIFLFGCQCSVNVFLEDVVQPFVEWWENWWGKPAQGKKVPPPTTNYPTPQQLLSVSTILNQASAGSLPKEPPMLINGTPIDHLSKDEENFLTFAFGKMVNGNLEVTIDDPLFQYVERKVNPVSPFLLWPEKLELTLWQYPGLVGFTEWVLCCNSIAFKNISISINSKWTLYSELSPNSQSSPEDKIELLNSLATDKVSSNAIALRYISKDAATAKQLLLANVGKVCKELESSGDDQTAWSPYNMSNSSDTDHVTDTSKKVIVGALLGIGGQELAMAMLLTSSDFHIQGLVQTWMGVLGA